MINLTGATAKVSRGLQHTQEAKRVLDDYIRSDFYRTTSKQRDTKGRGLVKVATINPFPNEFGLCVGDAAHNFRAALDHIVFAFASAEKSLTRKQEQEIQFPICSKSKSWISQRDSWLRHIGNRRVRALIERLQPYHRRKWPDTFLLAQLNAIDVWDKHRALSVAYIKVKRSEFSITVSAKGFSRTLDMSFNGPLKQDTVIARIDIPKGLYKPNVDVYRKSMTVVPAFDGAMPTPLDGLSAINRLGLIYKFLNNTVIPGFQALGAKIP